MPKNGLVSADKDVALILSFRNKLVNILDGDAYVTKVIKRSELYKDGTKFEVGLHNVAHVDILYIKGFLYIRTAYEVDVYLRGDEHIDSIHVETRGLCSISSDSPLRENALISLRATNIHLAIPIPDASFICLATGNDSRNAICIKKPVATKRLQLASKKISLHSALSAQKYRVDCELFRLQSSGSLALSKCGKQISEDVLKLSDYPNKFFRNSNSALLREFDNLSTSNFKANRFVLEGNAELDEVHLNVDYMHFNRGSKGNLANMHIQLKELTFAEGSEITGNDLSISIPGVLFIKGKAEVDDLEFNAEMIEIPTSGSVNGKKKLKFAYNSSLTVLGKATSRETIVEGDQCYAVYGGAIVGKDKLELKVSFSAVICGGRIAGHQLSQKAGAHANIFGITNYYSGGFSSLGGFELGNIHLPYVDLPTSRAEAYERAAAKIAQAQKLIPKNRKDIATMVMTDPKAAWQMFSSNFGVIRAMIATCSVPVAAAATVIHQSISFAMQLVSLYKTVQKTSNKSFDQLARREFLLTILEFKDLFASGVALNNNIAQAHAMYQANARDNTVKPESDANMAGSDPEQTETSNTDAPVINELQANVPENTHSLTKSPAPWISESMQQALSKFALDLVPLLAPNRQVDDLLSFSAPLFSATWIDSRQNLYSFRGGFNAAWMQYELTAYDQYDYSNRYANTLTLNTGNRYQYGHAYTNHFVLYANKAYVPEGGKIWSLKSTNVIIDNDLTSNGETNFVNGYVVANGTATFGQTSVTHNKEMRMRFGTLLREGHETYEGYIRVNAQHSASSAASTLSALQEESGYHIEADTSELLGAERHHNVTYKIKGMPVSELEDLFHGRGLHANKVVEKSIHTMSEMPGNASIVQSSRSPQVAHSMTTSGNIRVVEDLDIDEFHLHSTGGDVELQANVNTRGDQSYEAAGKFVKPAVTASSSEGNITANAGGDVDNSHGGKISAMQGSASVEGASFNNDTQDIGKRSTVESQNTFIKATSGDVQNRYGLILGERFVQVYAARDVNNNALEVSRWLCHSNATYYYGGEILGGSGTEHSNGYGAIVDAGNFVNNYASTIGSEAHTYVHGKNGVTHWTAQSIYQAVDYREDRSRFNKVYHKEQGVLWAPATIFGTQNTICSSEGSFLSHGANIVAAEGTKVWSKDQHITEHATARLQQSRETVIAKLIGSTRRETVTTEHIAAYQTKSGPIEIVSLEKGIKITGAIFIGSPGTQSSLRFQAHGDISVNRGVLNHQFRSSTWGVNLNIAGQSIFGGSNGNWAQRCAAFDPVLSSAYGLTQSKDPSDALINGYSTMGGLKDLGDDIGKSGLQGALAGRLGANLGFTRTQQSLNYQTLGEGYIYDFDEVGFDSTKGNVDLGIDIDNVRKLYVHADKFTAHGNELNSKMRYSSQTITPVISATGNADLNVSMAYGAQTTRSYIQTNMRVSVLSLDVNSAELSGARIECKEAEGVVRDTLTTKPLIGCTEGESHAVSGSASGNMNGATSSSYNESYDARGVLGVTDNDGMRMQIGKHVEYGEAGIVNGNGDAISVPGMAKEHHDVDLRQKQKGYSFGTNLVKIDDPKQAHTVQLGVDTQITVDRISTEGVTRVKESGHKFTFIQYFTPEHPAVSNDDKPTNEESDAKTLDRIDESNDVDPDRFRYDAEDRDDLYDSLNQLDDTGYLSQPGFANGPVYYDDQDQSSQDYSQPANRENFIERRHYDEPAPIPENRNLGSKVGDFFRDVMRDADEVQLDFWDVPSTPEVNEGRAAIVRGFGKGARNAAQPFLHPLDTGTDLVVSTWDGMNELSNLAFGVASQGSLERGNMRGRAIGEGFQNFSRAPANQKWEMGSEFAGTMLFGYAAGVGGSRVLKSPPVVRAKERTGQALVKLFDGKSPSRRGKHSDLRGDNILGGTRSFMENPSKLIPTHTPMYGKNKLKSFVDKIKIEGIQEPIKVVEHGDKRYVVDGHHRLYAAKVLKLDTVPIEIVELPYKGYKTVIDLKY